MQGVCGLTNNHFFCQIQSHKYRVIKRNWQQKVSQIGNDLSTGVSYGKLQVIPTFDAYTELQIPGNGQFQSAYCGLPYPLGVSIDPKNGGLNFSISSSNATAVNIVFFTEHDLSQGRVTCEVPLQRICNKTGDVWHIGFHGLNKELLYGYRVYGLNEESTEGAFGHKYDPLKVVIDPYAKGVIHRRFYGQKAVDLDYEQDEILGFADTWPQIGCMLPAEYVDGQVFDWQGDTPLMIPQEDLVIYEAHVRAFTQSPTSRVVSPGTYQGMTDKLDYLQKLGVNCVELLPIFEFNELEYYSEIGDTGTFRYNFWGYSTVAFFAPMTRYSARIEEGQPPHKACEELKVLVRESHKRGMEVILDVVFNHTAEGNELGPTLSFRGIDNRVYYMLAPEGQYYNYSGCGNTVNCNHPTVSQFIVDCLKYWVSEYHIDGFRFDLGSILTRAHAQWNPQEIAEDGTVGDVHSGGAITSVEGYMTNGSGCITGTPLSDPAVVAAISEEPTLRHVKLITEAWDCDGLNQVGLGVQVKGWEQLGLRPCSDQFMYWWIQKVT